MMDAKSYLRQVEFLNLRIQNKCIERQRWRDLALGITASAGGERVQTSSSQQKTADAIEKCVDAEAEIDALVGELVKTKREVIATIEQLESPTEYDILHKRYIQFLGLQEIADAYGKEYGWATTMHGRALKSVQAMLDAKA